ncbi:hypothetical protein FACS189414_0650 [Bacteroidia bacterium]|nr:hypothetical protein FACS189414_0650 [Bacteroidia bacterium]
MNYNMAWYELVLIISVGLFIFSTVGSIFFGNIDIDADVHLDGGFLVSDVISFKGLIHFALGFSLALTLWKEVTGVSIIVGIVTGLVFVVVLYYLYKIIYEKLQQSMIYTNEINDMEAEVYYWSSAQRTGEVFVTLEGRPVTITIQCPDGIDLTKGQKLKVSGTRKLVHPVINN